MTLSAKLSLAAPRGHVLAEAVQLAFAIRGAAVVAVPIQGQGLSLGDGPIRLTFRQGAEAPVLLRDPLAMLELAEDLHPARPLHPRDPLQRAAQREALAALPRIVALLDPLTRSADPRDIDLNTHLLRGEIGLIAARLSPPGDSLSLLDIAAAPLLWRIEALDRRFGSHLLTGIDRLEGWTTQLSRHPDWPGLPEPQLVEEWLIALAAHQGFITQTESRPDWSGALGPEGGPGRRQENGLPPAGARTKGHSIGSHRAIR